jgi:hypothetical protein
MYGAFKRASGRRILSIGTGTGAIPVVAGANWLWVIVAACSAVTVASVVFGLVWRHRAGTI